MNAKIHGRVATEKEVDCGVVQLVWCVACDTTDCALHGKDSLMVCDSFHKANLPPIRYVQLTPEEAEALRLEYELFKKRTIDLPTPADN